MHFFTRFRTYFNPRTPVFIKARQQSAGIKNQQEIISCFPYFTRMLIFCQIGAWMLRKLGQGMRSVLSGRHGCAGLVQFLRIFSKGWCVPAGGPLGVRPLRFRNGSAGHVVQCSLFCTVFDGINHPSKDYQTIVNQNKAAFSLVLFLFHS